MSYRSFILSLLVNAALGQRSDPVLPSFELVQPGATVTPTTTSTVVASSTPSRVPASLSFNPSQAPAFTPSSGAPNFLTLPAFPSTPCALSTVVVTISRDLSIGQPVPTPTPVASVPVPVPEPESPASETTPCSTNTTPMPTPIPSSEEGGEDSDDVPCPEEDNEAQYSVINVPSNTPLAGAAPTPAPDAIPQDDSDIQDDSEPCDEGEQPVVSNTPQFISSTLTTTFVTFPATPSATSGSASASSTTKAPVLPFDPNLGQYLDAGRLHAPNFMPSARQSRYPGVPAPSPSQAPEKDQADFKHGAAATTPYTLETRVRPTPTAL